MFTTKLSLLKTLEKIQSGEINVFAFINNLCNRIDTVEPEISSLLPEDFRRQRLLREAGELSEKYQNTQKHPPLFGIPVGIKDIFRVNGFPTYCGSRLPAELFIGMEASVVQQLKSAGALVLGKTVTTEFAYFQPGPTRNPVNTAYTPGGSSSGSAAAVAAGLTPLAFGTQTIGSIIRPASYCGIIGIKPSSGSISTDGVIPFSQTLDHIGYFVQDIESAAFVASIFCKEWATHDIENNKEKPVIGIPSQTFLQQADNEILAHFFKVLDLIKKQGINVLQTDIFSDIEAINSAHRKIAAREFAQTHKEWYNQYSELYSPHSVKLIETGTQVSDIEINEAFELRQIQAAHLATYMSQNGIDVWLSPSTATLPLFGLESTGSPVMNLPWTFTGVPVITFPFGKNKFNLPYGIQVSGKISGLQNLLRHTAYISKSIERYAEIVY